MWLKPISVTTILPKRVYLTFSVFTSIKLGIFLEYQSPKQYILQVMTSIVFCELVKIIVNRQLTGYIELVKLTNLHRCNKKNRGLCLFA